MRRISRRRFIAAATTLLASPARLVPAAATDVDDAAIGRLFILGFAGTTATSRGARVLAEHVRAGRVGGVCFLGHNMGSRGGVAGLTRLFRDSAEGRPLLIAVDQEGGAVQRLGRRLGYHAVRPAEVIAARNDPQQARHIYARMAAEMREAGFNLNLAPVVDLGFEPRNPTVAKWRRAFGKDGDTVTRYAAAFVAAHREVGVLTALKHFPGHGSTLDDSHDRPIDLTPTWQHEELLPFQRLVASGEVDLIMSGHLSHRVLTDGEPATLSPHAIDGVLRGEIGYRGVVLTDDLDMAAIRARFELDEAVIRALAAGNDLVLLSNSRTPDMALPQRLAAAVRRAVGDGRLSNERLRAAVDRVSALTART